MIIALIGPDGSGKTYYTNMIINYLAKKCQKTKIHYPFKYFVIRKIIDITRTRTNNLRINGTHLNKHTFYKLWPFVSIIDNYIDYFANIAFFKGIVICDRYYYDLATAFKEYNFTFNWLYRLYILLIPRPKLCIVLTGNPDDLKHREDNDSHSIEFFKHQTDRYSEISKLLRFITIDTSVNNTENSSKLILNELNKYL